MARGGGATAATPLLPGGSCASASAGALRRVLSAAGLYILAVGLTIPSRPALMLAASGGSSGRAALFAGSVDAAQALTSAVSGPVLGSLADILGRVPVLQLSTVGEFAAVLMLALFHASLPGQFVAYLLIAATGVFSTTIRAAIADLCPVPLEATRAYGRLGAVAGAAFMAGPAIGGFLAKGFGDTAPFLAASVLLAFVLVFVARFVPETGRTGDDDVEVMGNWWGRLQAGTGAVAWENPVPKVRQALFGCPAMARLVIAGAVSSLAESGLIAILFLYVNVRLGWGSPEVGAFVSATGLSVLIAQGFLASGLVQLCGERTVIVGGYIAASAHFVVYAQASRPWIMYAGLVTALPAFAAGPATNAVLARQVPSDKQGELQGSLAALNSLVKPLSSLGCAALFALGNGLGAPGAVFYVIASLSLLAAIIANSALRHPELKVVGTGHSSNVL